MNTAQLSLTLSTPNPHPHGGAWEWPTKDGQWACCTYPRSTARPTVARHSTWGAAMVRALALLNTSPYFYEAIEVRRLGTLRGT